MQHPSMNKLYGIIASAAIVLALVGCNGGGSGTATTATPGAPGAPGPSFAVDITTYSQDDWAALTLTSTITKVTMGGAPVVDFKIVDGHNVPVKGFGSFTSKAATDIYAKYPNLGFSIAKLVPSLAGSPAYWVNYIVTSAPSGSANPLLPQSWAPGKPSTENQGNLVDHGDGTYTYTFLHDLTKVADQVNAFTDKSPKFKADLDPTNLTYTENLPHRLTLFVGGVARGTGAASAGDRSFNTPDGSDSGIPGVYIKNPANSIYDFIPRTGATVPTAAQREITSVDKCFDCHAKFEFHSGGRQDTRYCVVCHNDQRKFGSLDGTVSVAGAVTSTGKLQNHAEGDFPSFIHRLHMGEKLTDTGYNYGGIAFNEVTYPMDQRNCVKCHSVTPSNPNALPTPQGDNWKTAPSRFACGGCHDNINWATGAGHSLANRAQADDSNCAGCHDAAYVAAKHIPVVPQDVASSWHVTGGNSKTNAASLAAYTNNLPAGASIVTWDLKSFFLDANGVPTFIFRYLKDGVAVVFNDPATSTEMMNNFIGGPSIYVAFNVPQDNISKPADWNASASTYLKNIWRGDGNDMTGVALAASAKATMSFNSTGANAGYYTLAFNTVATPTVSTVKIPVTANMVTGGIGYTYDLATTPPLTQTNVVGYLATPSPVPGAPAWQQVGGLTVPAPNVWKLASSVPGTQATQIARRPIVTNQKCNDCHGALGVFTDKLYHAGQRNDVTSCTFCHNTDRVASNGWGDNIKDSIHAIHGASKRVNKYSWEVGAGDKFWKVTYPSVLNNCEACHVPGSYDFDIINGADPTKTNQVFGNLLWSTVATGTTPNPVNVIVTGNETVPGTYWSPFAAASGPAFAFGTGFKYDAAAGTTALGAGTNLVSSAYVAACSNCHDTATDIAHFKTNGGAFYEARSTAFTHVEQCFLCHSAGKIADTRAVHMNFN